MRDAANGTEDGEQTSNVSPTPVIFDESLQKILDRLDQGIWEYRVPEDEIEVSKAVLRLLGHDPGELNLTWEKWADRVHPDDRLAVKAKFRALLNSPDKSSYRSSHRLRTRDGRWKWVFDHGHVVDRDPESRALRVVGLIAEIPGRELEPAREDLEAAETLMGMGSWSWDPQIDEVIWSHGVYALFRLDPNQPAPPVADHGRLFTPESFGRLQQALDACLKMGTAYQLELESIRGDGSHFFMLAKGTALQDELGKVIRLFGTVHDVSEQRLAEQRIYHANEELIRANSRMQEALQNAERLAYTARVAEQQRASLLAMMSHEIRTPLNAILGMASLLETTALSSEQAEYVHTLSASGQSLSALLNDILDFSKLEAGKITLESRSFSLLDLAHEAVIMFAGTARDKGIELAYVVKPGLVNEVAGDFYRLKQILINLLSNALKFTAQGGITLRLETTRLDETRVRLNVAVEDTGIGISKAGMDHLFEPFQQADSSITRKYGGTGLGLAISQQLAGLMDGKIHATSQLGQGSTFFFHLNLTSTATAPPVNGLTPNSRIVYLSSSQRNQEMLASLVEYLGAGFVAAGNLEQAQQLQPDLLIIDSSFSRELSSATSLKMKVIEAHPFGERGVSSFPKLSVPFSIPQLMDFLRKSSPRTDHFDTNKPLEQLPLRILVAEDNRINQRVILLMLQKLGHSAEVVLNGAEALRELSAKPYDLVLMDLQMPDVDGITATHLWRSAEAIGGGQVYICALTANATDADRDRCFEVGMNDYLSKPVVLTQLREMLTRVADHVREKPLPTS